MSVLYYAAFIPGLRNFIDGVIRERLSDVKIHKLLEDAVLFETQTTYDKLNFFCFNNIFAVISVLGETRAQAGGGKKLLEDHIGYISGIKTQNTNDGFRIKTPLSDINFDPVAVNNKKFKTFRIVVLNENVPASIDEKLRTEAEHFISGVSGLKVNRALPDTEFWFLYWKHRSKRPNGEKTEGQSFSIFMKRLTLRASWEKTLQKGELPPPLAWTMCRMASLKQKQTVLDPFCGYGSIPDSAIKHFHITDFIACDSGRQSVLFTEARLKKRKNGNFSVYSADIGSLPLLIAEESIDAIVTDPPWGQFSKINDSGFLKNMFDVFSRLLKDGGRAVILYLNDDNFLKAAELNFNLLDSFPVLLSGKKTVIYTLTRKNRQP